MRFLLGLPHSKMQSFKQRIRLQSNLSLISLVLCLSLAACGHTIPNGALDRGYIKLVVNEHPQVHDLSTDSNAIHKWFSGQWFALVKPKLTKYHMENNLLVIDLGGELASTPFDGSLGELPLLPGKDGFYIEVEVSLSGNDPDYWPSIWLMPKEHNGRKDDHYPGDPSDFERWMELDVDEGGFGPGLVGTVHSWTGVWHGVPPYQRISNSNNLSPIKIDRSHWNRFGVSFDPSNLKVIWWVNDVRQMSAEYPAVPVIAASQNFYIIVGANSHGINKQYSMKLRQIRAYVPKLSPLIRVSE